MQAVKPIALAKVMSISRMIETVGPPHCCPLSHLYRLRHLCTPAQEFPNQGRSVSGIGGVETGADAAEFILLGSDTVQVGGWVRGCPGC